ncbi:CDP-diacylglycerol-glycerol-3-phosphate 3-phosphatidyltransferase [Plasmodium inui San Antonio 1]|uniref:CDP-diacylglycerol--glycerol-3-phosphate 3-phosphatidyltransferase n=1 Tax=Plasmodium inui San Antonio 1 TaxID=1237626 RepID=W7A1G2_9APIC|nr:CDP-diacylglycerol-glycerol-3-phosphate 3-phosphatidyltransferase [Plasmodium inui San Antonio 1]EUD67027.1 CDP-diacylglycerol-glycerol-3-phosphate 3-phosphatidyltransferase [Plasmodium inui San Antonio 1]
MTLKFAIREPKVRVLFSPTEFFDTLKGMFRSSKNRIVISCLYIGIGELEKELIVTIKNNKNIKNLRVDVLLDKQRGTRPEGKLNESSVSVLSDLFSHGGDINISLFHNPLLGAILYNIMPYRANEAIGVMHMKAFIGDDRLILSGANLSDSYLRNRQDRYILIENKLLADSVHKIVNCIQKMSFRLNVDSSVYWDSDLMNPLVDAHTFREQYYRRIQFVLGQIKEDILRHTKGEVESQMLDGDSGGCRLPGSRPPPTSEREDFFSPQFVKGESILTVELGLQSGFSEPPIYDETDMLESVLKNVKKYDQSLIISSAYLNFPENFLKLFRNIYDNLCFKKGKIRFITASPAANSFFKSKGISYYIPLGYTISAHMCVEFVTKNIVSVFKNLNRTDPLKKKEKAYTDIYLEYHKPSWTFHSKGMWLIDDSFGRGVLRSDTSGEDPHVARTPQMENVPNSVCTSQNYEQSEKKKKKSPFGIANSLRLFNNDQNCLNRSATLEEKKKKNVCANILKSEEMDHNEHDGDNQLDTNNATSLTQNLGDLPWGTVIGSSNYGYRATYRDLEMSFVIKTNDENLKRQFQKELEIIYESTNFVHMDELNLRYPRWLRLLFPYLVRWLL